MRPVTFICWLMLLSCPLSAWSDEALALIMAPGHHSLRKDEAAQIFKRKKLFWSDGRKIQPVNLPASSPLRRLFTHSILGSTPEELEKYWNDMYFHGVSPPFVLTSEEAVLRFVAETPGAVGYVGACSVDSRVAAVLYLTPDGRVTEEAQEAGCPR